MAKPTVRLTHGGKVHERQSTLVVGATGHVGAALCRYLATRGHQVTAASRQIDRYVFGTPNINQIQLDVTDLLDSPSMSQFTTAIICPWIDESTGIEPPWIANLLECLVNTGLRSALYFSTMWVYGLQPEGLLTESTPANPDSSYGTVHLRNEQAVTEGGKELGLDTSILRMSNLVGSDPFYAFRSKISFAHELVEMAIRDRIVVLKSSPSTPRNLLPRALLHHYLDHLLGRHLIKGRVEVFNVGSRSTTSMIEFARQTAELAEGYDGKPVQIQHPEETPNQPTFHLDTRKIRSLAGAGSDDLTSELELVLADVLRNTGSAKKAGNP